MSGGIAAPVNLQVLDDIKIDYYLARCHHCDLSIPFDDREQRDNWVQVHREACRNAVDTWREIPRGGQELHRIIEQLRDRANVAAEYVHTVYLLRLPDPSFWLFWAWRHGIDHRWLTPRET